MRSLGIDIGSRFIKAVVAEDGRPVDRVRIETSTDPLERCREILRDLPADKAMATGYGRHLLEVHHDLPTVTEIKAFARGARAAVPGCSGVIDIGGQDTKVIALSEAGQVRRFEMNDKCAAGTGRFLEVMARSLGYTVEEVGDVPLETVESEVRISSMCTVFAESEVISLIARGTPREAVAAAVLRSVGGRVSAMARRLPLPPGAVFAGGCAGNRFLQAFIGRSLGADLEVPCWPEYTGAWGTALLAGER